PPTVVPDEIAGDERELRARAAEEASVGRRAPTLAGRQDVGTKMRQIRVVGRTWAFGVDVEPPVAVVEALPAQRGSAVVAGFRRRDVDDPIAAERTVRPAEDLSHGGV